MTFPSDLRCCSGFETCPLTCRLSFMSIFFIPVSAFTACHCNPAPTTTTTGPPLAPCSPGSRGVLLMLRVFPASRSSARLDSKDLSHRAAGQVPPALSVVKKINKQTQISLAERLISIPSSHVSSLELKRSLSTVVRKVIPLCMCAFFSGLLTEFLLISSRANERECQSDTLAPANLGGLEYFPGLKNR